MGRARDGRARVLATYLIEPLQEDHDIALPGDRHQASAPIQNPAHWSGFLLPPRGPQESRPSTGIFVPARNATAARAGPNGTVWTLLAGSVVTRENTGSPRALTSHAFRVARDRIGETGALGCQRCNGLRRTGGERPTQSGQAEGLPPAFQAEQRRVRFPLPAPNSIRYVLLRTFARSLNRASPPGLLF